MLNYISRAHDIKTFSICAENFTGEKGMAGRAEHGTGEQCARELGIGWKVSPSVAVMPGEVFTLADVKRQGAIKHIWITFGGNQTKARDLILRLYWDGSAVPSVELPLGDMFATANSTEYRQISSLAVCVNPRSGLNCYWEMPFRTGFKATIENLSPTEARVYYQIDCEEKAIPEDSLYFHGAFRRENPVKYMQPFTIVDGITGKGQYVGTYLYWGVNNNGWWGEGEIKFYIDGDTDYPTICGTGTEDYFCGSYDFDVNGNYIEFSSPYTGLSKIDGTDGLYKPQKRFNMYRWHINDPIYFEQNLRVTIQALGWRSGGRYLPLQDDISAAAFWYSDTCTDVLAPLPDANGLEIV